MIDLKAQTESLIQLHIDSEKTNLIECVFQDLSVLDYCRPTIKQAAESVIQWQTDDYGFVMPDGDLEKLVDYLAENIEELLKIEHGYYTSRGEIGLAHCDEIEIFLPENWKLTEYKRRAIRRHTDLYIPDNSDYGYYPVVMRCCIQLTWQILEAAGVFTLPDED